MGVVAPWRVVPIGVTKRPRAVALQHISAERVIPAELSAGRAKEKGRQGAAPCERLTALSRVRAPSFEQGANRKAVRCSCNGAREARGNPTYSLGEHYAAACGRSFDLDVIDRLRFRAGGKQYTYHDAVPEAACNILEVHVCAQARGWRSM